MFSNDMIQISLEKLKWEHVENNGKCYESFRLSQLEDESVMAVLLFRSLLEKGKVPLGNFSYEAERQRLVRHGPSIVSKEKNKNLLFTLGKPFKQWIDVDKDEGVRVVSIK